MRSKTSLNPAVIETIESGQELFFDMFLSFDPDLKHKIIEHDAVIGFMQSMYHASSCGFSLNDVQSFISAVKETVMKWKQCESYWIVQANQMNELTLRFSDSNRSEVLNPAQVIEVFGLLNKMKDSLIVERGCFVSIDQSFNDGQHTTDFKFKVKWRESCH